MSRSRDDLPVVDLYEILENIKERPVMYMGIKSIQALSAWIAGVNCGAGGSLGWKQPQV